MVNESRAVRMLRLYRERHEERGARMTMLTLRLWWRTVICLLFGHAWDDCYWPGRRVDYRFCDRCGECEKKERA